MPIGATHRRVGLHPLRRDQSQAGSRRRHHRRGPLRHLPRAARAAPRGPGRCGWDAQRDRLMPGASRSPPPTPCPKRAGAEAALRPSRLDEFVGQAAGEGVAPDRDRRRPGPGRAARPHPLLRPARPRQDHAGDADREGDGRPAPHHLGPGAREAGRPGRAAHHPAGRATSSSSTRSTGSGRCSRSSSIPRWRTSGWTCGSPTAPTRRPSR